MISNGNRAERSSIRSVVITSDECGVRIQFAFTSNDYRQNWTTQSPITNLIYNLQFPNMKEEICKVVYPLKSMLYREMFK